jgi:hypothetical protein
MRAHARQFSRNEEKGKETIMIVYAQMHTHPHVHTTQHNTHTPVLVEHVVCLNLSLLGCDPWRHHLNYILGKRRQVL